jgi:hypothetical protein
VERIVDAHGEDRVLHVSLEEFASAQSSRAAMAESLRQAGWGRKRIVSYLESREGLDRINRYHRAFAAARGDACRDVIHLVATFSSTPSATREFPFLVEVGPFGYSALRRFNRFPARLPSRGKDIEHPFNDMSPKKILWYASPDSSPRFAEDLCQALSRLKFRCRLEVRTSVSRWNNISHLQHVPKVTIVFLPELSDEVWRQRTNRADLVIVSGSQSLMEASAAHHPFLYFNGYFPGNRTRPRAFRREKLLSLLKAWRVGGVPERIVLDLRDFADGRNLRAILCRALTSQEWRRHFLSAPQELSATPPWSLPLTRAAGDFYLATIARRFQEHSGPVSQLVEELRREAYSQVL